MKEKKNKQLINIKKSKNITIGNLNINESETENAKGNNNLKTKNIKIVKMISDGNTKKALDETLKLFKENQNIYKEGIILLNRLNRVETENRLNIISSEDKNLELNRINNSLMQLLMA